MPPQAAPTPDGLGLELADADLGPLRLEIAAAEESVRLHLAAERAETADLFRRNAELLARDLRDLGFGQVTLSFGSGSEGRQQPWPAAPDTAGPPPLTAAPPSGPGPTAAGRLDLRL